MTTEHACYKECWFLAEDVPHQHFRDVRSGDRYVTAIATQEPEGMAQEFSELAMQVEAEQAFDKMVEEELAGLDEETQRAVSVAENEGMS